MEDNIFVNIIAYTLVGSFALVIVAVVLSAGLWLVTKIVKSASKGLPKKDNTGSYTPQDWATDNTRRYGTGE